MAVHLAAGETRKAVFTAEDLTKVQAATGKNYELVRGELFEVAPPTPKHGRIQVRIARTLDEWAERSGAGYVFVESGYWLERDPDTVRGPDVSFVAKGHIDPNQSRGFPAGAPDLAVEIRSPNDTWPSLERKAQEYLAAGTKLVLLIEPDEFLQAMRPKGQNRRLKLEDLFEADDVLPGFRCHGPRFLPRGTLK